METDTVLVRIKVFVRYDERAEYKLSRAAAAGLATPAALELVPAQGSSCARFHRELYTNIRYHRKPSLYEGIFASSFYHCQEYQCLKCCKSRRFGNTARHSLRPVIVVVGTTSAGLNLSGNSTMCREAPDRIKIRNHRTNSFRSQIEARFSGLS